MRLTSVSYKVLMIAGATLLWLSSCKEKTKVEPEDSFDRTLMLANIADNVIAPSYEALKKSTDSLVEAISTLETDVTSSAIVEAKSAFTSAYFNFQAVSFYNVGYAATISFGTTLNSFPADEEQIETNIGKDNVILGSAENTGARGFPSMGFLLYQKSSVWLNNPESKETADEISYLKLLAEDIQTNVNAIFSNWNGGYRDAFVAADGVDIGSSTGIMVNEFSKSLELIKNVKLGIPLGKQSLNNPRVDLVEGKYMERSAALAKAHTQALYNIYKGANGIGFDDYIQFLNAASNGQALHNQIVSAFETALTQFDAVNDPMADAIINDKQPVEDVYTTFQSTIIRLIKVDMSSAMGVQISYVDNDGD